MKHKKHTTTKRAIGAIVLSGLAAGSMFWIVTSRGKKVQVPASTAYEVVDGDTFKISQYQLVRLSGIDAPEMGRCGSEEAKEALATLIVGKPLYVDTVNVDPFRRLSSRVYADGVFVNEAMLRAGWAVVSDRNSLNMPGLQKATDEARAAQRGVFGSECTQTTNPKDPTCVIKANIDGNKRIYHLPGCQYYKNVTIQLYFGDQWFCTEAEAKRAGYRKSRACP